VYGGIPMALASWETWALALRVEALSYRADVLRARLTQVALDIQEPGSGTGESAVRAVVAGGDLSSALQCSHPAAEILQDPHDFVQLGRHLPKLRARGSA
jgi:hypothetical protein